MSTKEINNRGLACPQPVINTKKALEGIVQGTIISIVDNEVAKENVTRYAENAGCQVSVETKNGEYYIAISKGETIAPDVQVAVNPCKTDAVVYFFTSNTLGSGAEDLGETLMISFFNSLLEKPAPRMIMLVNSGIRLAVQHSRVLDQIKKLVERGTEVLACGTCLDYYQLKDQLSIGRITNMLEILDNLVGTDKVITL